MPKASPIVQWKNVDPYSYQTFPFLSLPGELRNMIYQAHFQLPERMIEFGDKLLFRAQPALTRVNKQVRTESLSIYYSERTFLLRVHLGDDRAVYDQHEMGYADFCRMMRAFEPAEESDRADSGHFSRVSDLRVRIRLGLSRPRAIFGSVGRRWLPLLRRVGEDDTDWADQKGVGTLVWRWMRKENILGCAMPETQERLVQVLRLLALRLNSDVWTFVAYDL